MRQLIRECLPVLVLLVIGASIIIPLHIHRSRESARLDPDTRAAAEAFQAEMKNLAVDDFVIAEGNTVNIPFGTYKVTSAGPGQTFVIGPSHFADPTKAANPRQSTGFDPRRSGWELVPSPYLSIEATRMKCLRFVHKNDPEWQKLEEEWNK